MVGSHLADYIFKNTDWDIYGLVRWDDRMDNIEHLMRWINNKHRIKLIYGDINDLSSLLTAFDKAKPDYVFHLAAQSYVGYSFEDEFSTFNTNINGTHYVLSAVKEISIIIKIIGN